LALTITVAHTSAGLFTVTIGGSFPLPSKLIYETASLSVAATLTAKAQTANIVLDSWDPVERTFQIVIHTVGDVADSAYADPVVEDANDLDRVNFELIGSICSAGTDLA
jgi:hypothetical protein